MGILSSFFENLQNSSSEENFSSRLHQKVSEKFPNKSEEEQLKLACLSGLMARIAYNDMKIHDDEKKLIINSLKDWMGLSDDEANQIGELCLEEVKDLAGVENHLYCLPLRESLSEKERFKIVESLFAVAAADGSVENAESEEIRNINHGLLLEHKHFVAARSQVLEKLASLRKD